jgi:hypothetical protein
MYRRETKWTLTWTGQIAVSNGNADDDATIMSVDGADEIYAEWNTVDATTGAPNFDFHLESGDEKATFTNNHYSTLKSAVAINKIDAAPVTPSPRYLKALLDVNNVELAATETVTLIIRARWL